MSGQLRKWSCLPIASEAHVDQPIVHSIQFFEAETEPRHHSGPEAFYQNIRLPRDREQRFLALRVFQIQGHAFLAAIRAREDGWIHGAGIVASSRLFNLDDLRAPVRQLLSRNGAGEQSSEIQNYYSG